MKRLFVSILTAAFAVLLASPAAADEPKGVGPVAQRSPIDMRPCSGPSPSTHLFNPGMLLGGVTMIAGGLVGAIVGGNLAAGGGDTREAVGGVMAGVGGGFVLVGTALAIVGGLRVKASPAGTARITPGAAGLSLRF